jgi:hypothetical protein
MKSNCKVEFSEYLQGTYLAMKPSRRQKRITIFLSMFLFTLSMLSILMGLGLADISIPLLLLSALSSFPLTSPIIARLWLPRYMKKIYEQQKSLHMPQNIEFTEDQFASTVIKQWKWTDFRKYKIDKEMIVLYESDLAANILPRRWFSEDEYEKLLLILKNALGEPE